MFRVTSFIVLCLLFSLCHCVHQPYQQLGPQRYEIEEDPAKQSVPASYHRTILAPKQAYDQNQLNQYYQLQQLNQLNQLQQQQAAAAAGNPQNHQYLASLQQFYAASKQPQNAYSAAPAAQSQYVPQQAAQQQGYPQPLGVLYSAASDVSQFQFSGNGVNYSF
ncbi:basic-leucine zipper transcription factor A-like [Planococcus citri]|uniref:basic-leucine zipper transcription factor A-like n=1 Tax=Planococcus citri TaxID=170843 RepID=UPI0031F9F741